MSKSKRYGLDILEGIVVGTREVFDDPTFEFGTVDEEAEGMLDFINQRGAVLLPVSVMMTAVKAMKSKKDLRMSYQTLERYFENGGFTYTADGQITHKSFSRGDFNGSE